MKIINNTVQNITEMTISKYKKIIKKPIENL